MDYLHGFGDPPASPARPTSSTALKAANDFCCCKEAGMILPRRTHLTSAPSGRWTAGSIWQCLHQTHCEETCMILPRRVHLISASVRLLDCKIDSAMCASTSSPPRRVSQHFEILQYLSLHSASTLAVLPNLIVRRRWPTSSMTLKAANDFCG